MSDFDVAIVGGGIAGSTGAAVLGRAGYSVALISPHRSYPPDFRCEKLNHTQSEILRKIGLADDVIPKMTSTEQLWAVRAGRLVKHANDECYFLYEDLVNTVREAIPATVAFVEAKAEEIETSDDRQRVTLSTGEQISARLVVMANGLNVRLTKSLGIERKILSEGHSITIGFYVKPVGKDSFAFPALTYFPDHVSQKLAYLSLFPIGPAMRANFFLYRDLRDPWLKEFRERPEETLFSLIPGLKPLTGDMKIDDPVVRPVDLYVAQSYDQPGIVLVGDAFSTSCPAVGTGVTKALLDIERLCGAHIPKWLASDGMGVEKITAFYNDSVKTENEMRCIKQAFLLRAMSVQSGPYWIARRWLRHSPLVQAMKSRAAL